jgi:ammonium transporter, Amt family
MHLATRILAPAVLFIATPALAQPEIVSDSGDTAWVLIASALVLLMTLPGLALFYGGLVRSKNVLSVLMQCFVITCTVSLLWAVVGYSLVFDGSNPWIGGLNRAFLGGLDDLRDGLTIPESTFALFQMTFAIITPALVIGAFVERIRFGWVVAFSLAWTLFVYIPVAHWVWGGGWLSTLGTADFAGGIVVHTTAGIAALVLAKMLGARKGFDKSMIPPHSPALVMTGAGLLWVGWYGFNGGSALAASDDASSAILNTHLAACAAALVWIAIERIKIGKSTSIGVVTGAVAGLATITPGAGVIASVGQVGPMGAIILGMLAGLVCFYAVQLVKMRFKLDDSLDVFAVHGVGGMMGSILFPLFVLPVFGGSGFTEGVTLGGQLFAQVAGVGVTALWTLIATVAIAFIISYAIPMRVDEEAEHDGLDLSSHGERGWDIDA